MKIKKDVKSFKIFKYIFLTMLLLALFTFIFWKDIFILITHISHKSEIIFIEKFIEDFKNNDIEKLKGYFLNVELNMRALRFMKMYDKQLQTRIYYIDEFGLSYKDDEKTGEFIKIKDKCFAKLSTLENGKRLEWIEIFIIKKDGKYYIEHFQISKNFPRKLKK